MATGNERSDAWPLRQVLPAIVLTVAACVGPGGSPGGTIATPPTVTPTAAPTGSALAPTLDVEAFRVRWNETAALSAESDPLGIWRFDESTPSEASFAWPEAGLQVGLGLHDGRVRKVTLHLAHGSEPGRQLFVHAMAVVITVTTPRLGLRARSRIYETLASGCAAAGGDAFSAEIEAPGVRFRLTSEGKGDAKLIADLGLQRLEAFGPLAPAAADEGCR